jgi:4-hydroxybenzoate polyprenyltransferase
MIKILRYILLRFPPYQLLPLSLLFGLSCTHPLSLTGWVITAFAFLSYLFELRIFDEFKDYKHDSLYYPDRPIQKGIISLHELKHIGTINFLIQGILVITFRPNIYLFCIVQCYTLLMSRDFFIKDWLEKHFSLNILLHEIVTPFIFLYLMSHTS